MTMQQPVQFEEPSTRPQFMAVARKYRKTLLIGLGIGVVLGGLVAIVRPTTYTTSTTILFPPAPISKLTALAGGGGDSDLPSLPLLEGALSVPQPGSSTSTAGILLQSQQTELKIAHALDLQKVWKLPNDYKVLKQFHRELECKAGKNSDLTISFQDQSRDLAYQVIDLLVKELKAQSQELGFNPAKQSVEFLQAQLDASNTKWTKSQQDLLVYSQQHRIISLADQAKGLADQYTQVQKDLTTAQITTAAAYRQLDLTSSITRKLVDSCVDPVTAATAPTPLATLYQKVKDTESDLALLRDRLTPNNPEVKDKRLVFDEAKRQLQVEVTRQLSLLKNGSSPAVAMLAVQAVAGKAGVDGLLDAQKKVLQQIDALPQQEASYARLTAEVEANLDEVKLLREELEKARIIAARSEANFIIADPPTPALEHDPGYRLLLLLILTIFGVSIAALRPYCEWAKAQAEYKDSRRL